MCFWYLFIVYVLAVARKHKFIRQCHQVFQSEFQSKLFKNSATTNKIISICLIDKILSTYWKNSSQKRQIVVESSKEFSSKLQMASPINSDSNSKQKDRLSTLQLWTHIPTYYLKVSTTYQLFQTVNQSSAVRHDFNLRYRLFSSFKVRKIK